MDSTTVTLTAPVNRLEASKILGGKVSIYVVVSPCINHSGGGGEHKRMCRDHILRSNVLHTGIMSEQPLTMYVCNYGLWETCRNVWHSTNVA
jgi:hypothetical protein